MVLECKIYDFWVLYTVLWKMYRWVRLASDRFNQHTHFKGINRDNFIWKISISVPSLLASLKWSTRNPQTFCEIPVIHIVYCLVLSLKEKSCIKVCYCPIKHQIWIYIFRSVNYSWQDINFMNTPHTYKYIHIYIEKLIQTVGLKNRSQAGIYLKNCLFRRIILFWT